MLIDLIGYGASATTRPMSRAYTQPAMYQAIKQHPPLRELYARRLIDQRVVTEQESTEMTDQVWAVLTDTHPAQGPDRRRRGGRPRHR